VSYSFYYRRLFDEMRGDKLSNPNHAIPGDGWIEARLLRIPQFRVSTDLTRE
jgi:hypothetical protein